jgi:hypothetical protein
MRWARLDLFNRRDLTYTIRGHSHGDDRRYQR